MRKVKGILLGLTGLCFAIGLAACSNTEESSASYVTLEINPGVEFVVEVDGKVSAANGLNDDGKMLITEEVLVGLELDAAIEVVLNAAVDCKYLYEGEDATYQRDISISVTSETEDVQASLESNVTATINAFVDKEELNAKAVALEAKTREHFESIALQYDPSLTEEQLNELEYKDLMEYVELATIEKSELISMALQEYYISFKEYQFELEYKEQIAEKLAGISSIQSALYSVAFNILKGAVNAIDELQYNLFVSPESNYLELLAKIQEYKDSNTKLTYKLSSGGSSADIEVTINANKESIEKIEAQIVSIMNTFNSQLESAKAAIRSAIKTLEDYEKQISQIDFIQVLTNVENTINNTKTGVLASFEETYADDIAAAKAKVAERKAELEKSIQ